MGGVQSLKRSRKEAALAEAALADARAVSVRFRISVVCLISAILAIFYLQAVKITDFDFWWHIKAGDIMLKTMALIRVEPFSWIRSGLPYLPRYEYLSQVVMALVFHLTGATGIIIWKSAMVALAFSLILLVDKRGIWPNALAVVWLVNTYRLGFLERPQLFTNVFYAAAFLLISGVLDAPSDDAERLPSLRRTIAGLAAIQVLWANFHGGAHIMGFALFGAFLAERFARRPSGAEMRLLAWGGVALLAASFVTPNTYRNYTYLWRLVSEPSNKLITEWQPRPWDVYLASAGPLWLLALGALALTRRNLIFCGFALLFTGALSRRAYRHEILFSVTALGVAFHQLRANASYQLFLTRLASRPARAIAATLVLGAGLAWWVQAQGTLPLLRSGVFGYGISARAKGACDFLERERIQGRMFNSYDIGGYLIYRGTPDRLVFIDGRNVDYGQGVIESAILASKLPERWQELDDRYHFTYAVFDFAGPEPYLRYAVHLDRNPAWTPVYFDDWCAVYLKDLPENREIIARRRYRLLTPSGLEFGLAYDRMDGRMREDAEKDLERFNEENPESFKGRLALARRCLDTKRADRTEALAREVVQRMPALSEGYETLGLAQLALNRWGDAGDSFERALKFRRPDGPAVNFGFLAGVFEKAGEIDKAVYYRKKADESR